MGIPALQPGSASLPGSALFIDVPNVLHGSVRKTRINWRVLTAYIAERDLQQTKLIHAGAYARNRSEGEAPSRWLDEALYRRRKQHTRTCTVEATRRDGKDVDSWIMNDMWMATTLYHLYEFMAHEETFYPFKMKYVLVSGDGGYLRSFRNLEKAYGDHMLQRVIVYAWRDHLSGQLREFVGEDRIRYLDEIPGVQIDTSATPNLAAE